MFYLIKVTILTESIINMRCNKVGYNNNRVFDKFSEPWAKLAQKWLVCVPLGIHLEPTNRVDAVSDNIIIINCDI